MLFVQAKTNKVRTGKTTYSAYVKTKSKRNLSKTFCCSIYLNNIRNKSRVIILCWCIIRSYSSTDNLSLNLFCSIFGYSCLNSFLNEKKTKNLFEFTIAKPLLCEIPNMARRSASVGR